MKTNYVFGEKKLFTINRKAIESFLYANLLKATILLVFFLTSSSVFSQNTILLDPNFEQELINQGYDLGPIDGVVPTNNINGDRLVSDITMLSINGKLDSSFIIYPNPSYGMINIKSNFDYYNIPRIELSHLPRSIDLSRIDSNNTALNKSAVLE